MYIKRKIEEKIKSLINSGMNPDGHLYYYRDNNQKEIDILIEQNNKVHPLNGPRVASLIELLGMTKWCMH